MSDETTQFVLGDAAADAVGQGRRGGGFFRRRKGKKDRPPLTHCENCAAPLTGEYCANCGQHAIDYRRSLLRVLIDAADSFLNWDTKFLKSVGILIARPWRLTNDFNAGRRARYVHPLRLYLLASIAFFLLAKLINIAPSAVIQLDPKDRAELDAALGKLTAPDSILTPELRAKVDAARAKFMGSELNREERASLDRAALKLSPFAEKTKLKPKDVEKLDAILNRVMEAPSPPPAPSEPPGAEGPIGIPALPTTPNPRVPTENSHVRFDADGEDKDKPPFKSWMERRIKDKVGDDGTRSQLFLDTLRSNIPTMMLCCIPLFAFVLKVLYMGKRRFYIEHLVYALHIHTFAYVGVVLITLLAMGADRAIPELRGLLIGLLSLGMFVQVFLSIRRVYRQGWFMSTFKFLLGGVAYLIILVTAVAATAFVTLLLP